MYKILAIGNSFSQDATAYLHDIAAAGGTDTKIVNLYIGGCSLKTHWENAENDHKNYLGKILIIDDEKQMLALLSRILELEGYEVYRAATCKAGLR